MRLFRSATRERTRRVKRVLVMLEYEDGDPDNGEVFDLTDLAKELRLKDEKYHHAQITMKVEASCDYSRRDEVGYEPKTEICWNVMQAFDSSGDSGWLDDAVNASLPTSETTRGLIKRVSKAEKNLEKLRDAVKEQRLAEAAEVRGKYPICRIMPNATGLAEVSAKEG